MPPTITRDYVPLGANKPLTQVTPTAFTLSDGAQTFTNTDALRAITFEFATDSNGLILSWIVNVQGGTDGDPRFITTTPAVDIGFQILDDGFGEIDNDPGGWIAEPTLLLMTLTLMALGLVARRFQRVAG